MSNHNVVANLKRVSFHKKDAVNRPVGYQTYPMTDFPTIEVHRDEPCIVGQILRPLMIFRRCISSEAFSVSLTPDGTFKVNTLSKTNGIFIRKYDCTLPSELDGWCAVTPTHELENGDLIKLCDTTDKSKMISLDPVFQFCIHQTCDVVANLQCVEFHNLDEDAETRPVGFLAHPRNPESLSLIEVPRNKQCIVGRLDIPGIYFKPNISRAAFSVHLAPDGTFVVTKISTSNGVFVRKYDCALPSEYDGWCPVTPTYKLENGDFIRLCETKTQSEMRPMDPVFKFHVHPSEITVRPVYQNQRTTPLPRSTAINAATEYSNPYML